jgi:hypothetical protein
VYAAEVMAARNLPPVPGHIRRHAWRRRAQLIIALLFAGAVVYRIVKALV